MDATTTHTEFKFSDLLSQHGMSKRTLSRLAGISPALLTMMLKGQRTFKYIQIQRTSSCKLRHEDNAPLVAPLVAGKKLRPLLKLESF